jgi:hypothetical protein
MYTDGNVNKREDSFSLTLHEKDLHILYKFRDLIYIGDKKPEIKCYTYPYYMLSVASIVLVQDLIKHGCIPNKTFNIKIPTLDFKLMRHFIRGVYDGDGGISISENRVRLHLTGSKVFLIDIKNFWKTIGISSGLSSSKKPNISGLWISSYFNVFKAIDYIYYYSNIHLERKMSLSVQAIDILKLKLQAPDKYAENVFSYKGQKVSKKFLSGLSVKEKEPIADAAFEYFRKYGFPYPKFSEKEREDDFAKLKNTNCTIINGDINGFNESGLKIFKHHCPNYFKVKSGKLPSMIDSFNNDSHLMNVIKNRLGITYKEEFNLTGNMLRQGFRNSYNAFGASVFKPSVAKFVYDYFCNENSSVLDISAGFGQRMMGAAASNKVVRYVGLDPWNEGIENLKIMHEEEFSYFDVDLIVCGSEKFKTDEVFDFCFSSPPYYNKEVYDEVGQAYHNRSFEDFISDWWVPTVKMINNQLKSSGLFILNMDSKMAEVMLKEVIYDFTQINEFYLKGRKKTGKIYCETFYVLQKRV